LKAIYTLSTSPLTLAVEDVYNIMVCCLPFKSSLFIISAYFILTPLKASFISTGSTEIKLKLLEQELFANATIDAIRQGASLRGFYHTSAWKAHWREVITEQLRIIDGYNSSTPSLLSFMDKLHVTVADIDNDFHYIENHIHSLNLTSISKVNLVRNNTVFRNTYKLSKPKQREQLRDRVARESLSEGEYATIMAMHTYCSDQVALNNSAYVVYFHTKGSCCPKYPPSPVSDWRDEMNAFILEFPSICLRAMNKGYSTCGVEYTETGDKHHFAGNFFWANCLHISRLPPLWDPINNAFESEFFVLNVSSVSGGKECMQQCMLHEYHCRRGRMYKDRCPRAKYLPVIEDFLQGGWLLSINSTLLSNCTKNANVDQ
jgi:hypothetical protein